MIVNQQIIDIVNSVIYHLTEEKDAHIDHEIHNTLKEMYAVELYCRTCDDTMSSSCIDNSYYVIRDSINYTYYSEIIELFVSEHEKDFYKDILIDLLDEDDDLYLYFHVRGINDDLDIIDLALKSPSEVYYPSYNRARKYKRNFFDSLTIKEKISSLYNQTMYHYPKSSKLIELDPINFMCLSDSKIISMRKYLFDKV